MDADFKQFLGAFDLKSPRVVDAIDSVLLRLIKLRDFAADVHGVVTPPPVILASAAAPKSASRESSDRIKIEDVPALIHAYRSDERSQYHQLRHRTRENYDHLIKRILKDCGGWKLSDLKREDFGRIYEEWKGDGKLAMAHSLITMLRSIVSFGATIIEDPQCLRLSVVLHRMKFETVTPRSQRDKPRLTAQHVYAIRAQAHKEGRVSVALAQSLQFEARLAQKDVIGEWVPHTEPVLTPSPVLDGSMKWSRGVRWNEIDDAFILKHVTSAKQEEITIDLKTCPSVMDDLKVIARVKPNETFSRSKLPRVAHPVIVNEDTGKPYLTHTWRRTWRRLATAADVPKEVENRDSRMGGPENADAEERERASAG